MTTSPSRPLAVLVLVVLMLTAAAGPAGAVTTTASAQQPLVTEAALEASVTGDFVVVAGWFELTGVAEGSLDTRAQETNLGWTFDVDPAETFGEFNFSGEVVGSVNASRVLLTVEGNGSRLASSFGGGESGTTSAVVSTTGGAAGGDRSIDLTGTPAALSPDLGSPDNIERAPVVGPFERTAHDSAPSVLPTTLQLSPLRSLGISFYDIYWQLATLVLGLVVVGILPNFSRRVATLGAGDPLRTGGAGLAVVLVVPVALLILGLSLFGIPLAIAGTAVYLVLWWIGAVYGRFTVGLWLLGAVPRGLSAVDIDIDIARIENRWAGLLVGTFVVGVLVLLPVVGPIIEFLVVLLGLGGGSRLAYRSYQRTERVERAHSDEATTEPEEDSGRQ